VADRYVVVGLARSRCRWFTELARWADAGIAPIEFVKCLTTEEARAVLGAGRAVSLLLVDSDMARVDRDLIAEADRADAPTVVVGATDRWDWEALGCVAALRADFNRDELVELLDRIARRVTRHTAPQSRRVQLADEPQRGLLVGVVGTGGTGSSTIAVATAQACAAAGQDTVLVDGCRRADLAMYHDVGDVIPGLPELVDLHRADEPDPEEIRSLEFTTDRGYRLVLGMRRSRDWAAMRPRSVAATLDGLRRSHAVVVVDADADLETEAETGSADVEDRHILSLEVARRGDAVVAVAGADMKGVHDVARLLHDLVRCGTPSERIVVVLNNAPRAATIRTRLARAVRSLTADVEPCDVLLVRHHRQIDAAHRDATPLPSAVGASVLDAVRRVDRSGGRQPDDPVRIRVGELGSDLSVGAEAGVDAAHVEGGRR